jgi:hypothetical protein
VSLVVGYDVVVAGGAPAFFLRYCEATEVPVARTPGGGLRAGPFLSAYEASWLAGLTPHARAELSARPGRGRSGFAVPDEERYRAELGGAPSMVRATEHIIAGITFVDASLRFVTGMERRALYAWLGGSWRRVADFPWPDDPYQSSFGLAVGGSPAAPVFLQVENDGRGTGAKRERLRAFRLGSGGERGDLGAVLLTEFLEHDGALRFTCSRLDPAARFVQYVLALERLPAAANLSLKLHAWDDWPAGTPQPELVQLGAVVRRAAELPPWAVGGPGEGL